MRQTVRNSPFAAFFCKFRAYCGELVLFLGMIQGFKYHFTSFSAYNVGNDVFKVGKSEDAGAGPLDNRR